MSAHDKVCSDRNVLKCTVALYFGLDNCQIKLGSVQVNPRCPTVISCSE